MSAAEQRELLEQLMGKDLLVRLPKDYNKTRDPIEVLKDPKICKSFLVGTCPTTLFVGTKEDLGRCPKLHLEKHKILYEIELQKGVDFTVFQMEYYRDLERLVNDCNRKVRNANLKLNQTPEDTSRLDDISQQLDEVDLKIGLMVQEIQLLIEQAKFFNKSIEQLKELNRLLQLRKDLSSRYTVILESLDQAAQQKLQVCSTCSAYLSRLDSDRRLADHFVGKIHLGYYLIKNEYNEWRKKLFEKI
ncbi:unnamed protein product [Kuraishia capsulata CBS 1993]|uniref:Uncharacterized protein n=1 Tax=Kuraishia capsulata CBS 1993 TaxID=1382522 RepID=W6MQS4_9ASCO|nr:uncharacterized protein KUCA_T00005076001 [Kuraishia capsulata CBS 1993]CDK29089.1 unnamed protein product [Kuraishia capsulata CBS 1993]